MIYDSIDVRISVSNKGQVWWGGGGGKGGVRTTRTLPLDRPLQFDLLSFVTQGNDLPEILGKTTAQESKKSTYGWYASFKNA